MEEQTLIVVLNLFFIRSAVGVMHAVWKDAEVRVSIPSSSGLLLECDRRGEGAGDVRLNPFFIRSAVGVDTAREMAQAQESQSLLHQVCCWSPPQGREHQA